MKRNKPIPKEIECFYCKGKALAFYKNRRFCSQQCAHKARYVPSQRTGENRPCVYCGEIFYIPRNRTNRKTVFCSQDHAIAFWQQKAHRMNCIVCGAEFFCQPSQVRLRNRRTCSVKCRAAMQTKEAIERARIEQPTPAVMRRRIRYSKRMKDWRLSVFQRDNYTCQGCGERGGYLEADHIKPFALFPELRFDLSNGRTMCRPCHQQTETWGHRGKKEKKETAISEITEV